MGYSTLCRNLHEWGYGKLRPRPHAQQADPVQQEAFIHKVNLVLPSRPELWFQDETGFWANPAAYSIWAPKGSQPLVPRLGGQMHLNIMGAVRPEDGRFFAFIASHGNQTLFQIFLDQIQDIVNKNRRVVMILDNARFHKVKELNWGCIEPWYLPPYSPELNPIETLWLVMKKRFSNQWAATSEADLEHRVAEALAFYDEHPNLVRSACAITKYL